MRKVILGLAVSLDGFIEGPNGEYDWCFTDQDYGMRDFFKRIDTIFIGRKTYEMTMKADNDSTENNGPFSKIKQYVFSNTLKSVDKKSVLINGKIETKVSKIKKEKGKDIWLFGGAGLTTSFINKNLIDEIMLAVHPILLGAGKPLFKDIEKRVELTLIDTKRFTTGLVQLTYELKSGEKTRKKAKKS